jgi:hypothetical protein
MRRSLSVAAVVCVLGSAPWLLTAPPAFAATDCVGTHAGETFPNGLNVPSGRLCTLQGSTVIGDATVQPDAALVISLGSRVTGDVRGFRAAVQVVTGSVVEGDVSALNPKEFGTPTGTITQIAICGSTVGGSITVTGATGAGPLLVGGQACQFFGGGSAVGGNLLLLGNHPTGAGPIAVSNNRVSGILTCRSNDPAPVGAGNVARVKTGQCASL